MKKVKFAFWLVILGFVGLVIIQNKSFFMNRQQFGINLVFFDYKTPELPNAVIFIIFFLFGLVTSYVYMLFGRMKASKTIRQLNEALSSQRSELTAMKNELAAMKPQPPPPTPPEAPPESEPAETV